jgi:Transcriptional regulator, AbiEi antitoxin/Protein of unknown function (DUF559)
MGNQAEGAVSKSGRPKPPRPRSPDAAIAALAANQHGVVTTRQLAALGVPPRAVSRRAADGRLHRVHRGVYAVGHPVLTERGRLTAAVLAGGEGTVLSHAAAAALWGIRASDAESIDVTTDHRSGRRKRPRLRIHRPRTLRPDEITTHDGIPVTTPARTVLDLAATLRRRPLERILDRVEVLELTDYPALHHIADAHPGHRGAPKLRAALDTHRAGTTLTKSELEERFLGLCRAHGLPTPLVNTWPSGQEVDFRFPGHALIVEADSWTHHRSRTAFENDRARDARHTRAGYRTLRFTHRQLTEQPATVAQTVAAGLRTPA